MFEIYESSRAAAQRQRKKGFFGSTDSMKDAELARRFFDLQGAKPKK